MKVMQHRIPQLRRRTSTAEKAWHPHRHDGASPQARQPGSVTRISERFHTGGARPPTQVIIAYIDGRKPASPVVPICRVLSETGIQIAPSTCQAALKTPVSARELTGVYLVDAVVACFPRPPRGLGVAHAVAPAAPRRSQVGRDQVGRLMRIVDRAWGTPTRRTSGGSRRAIDVHQPAISTA